MIIVPAAPGHFFQPGKNSLSLKQLAGLPKTPWRACRHAGLAETMIKADRRFKSDTVPLESIRRGYTLVRYLFFTKYRTRISWIVVFGLLGVLVFSRTRFESDVIKTLLNHAGLLLVAIGVFGRIWTSIYISGYKTDTLISQGSYSMVRNPLYIFSFLGVLGLAISSHNFLFLGAIVGAYLFYYPFVVLNEQDELRAVHGESFERYRQETPCFIPDFKKFRQPEKYEVNIRAYNRSFLDAIWFFVAYIAVDILKLLQAKHMVPVLFDL